MSVRVAGVDPRLVDATGLARAVRVALQDPRETLVGLTVRGEFSLRGRHAVPAALALLADRDVATLSSGEARRVSLATAASSAAPLLLLDEPSEGLDPAGRGVLRDLVVQAARHGAVVAADHDGWLDDLATRRLDLGAGQPSAPLAPLPCPASSKGVLTATASVVRQGDVEVRLPRIDLPAGVHAVVGPNGAGKSTLLLRLAGLLDADGVAIQDTAPLPGGNVRMLLPHAGDLVSHATVAAELEGCEDLGLVPRPLLDRHPLALSAGEAQRVGLTKALGRPASLVLLDEPEAHLDREGRALLWRLLARRTLDGACILLATHDPDLAAGAHTRLVLDGPGGTA